MAKSSSGKKKQTRKGTRITKGKGKAKKINRKNTGRGAKVGRISSRKATSKKASKKSKITKSSSRGQDYSIVRIMGAGQYRLNPQDMAQLNRIDNSIVKFVENHHDSLDAGVQTEFQKQLNEMISLVKTKGTEIHAKEIVASDIILPFEDTTVEEARAMFKGEGLVPE